MTNLYSIAVDGTEISSLTALSALNNVSYLSLKDSPLDISALSVIPAYFPAINSLRLSNRYDYGGGVHPLYLATDYTALLTILTSLPNLDYLELKDFYGDFDDSRFATLYTQVLEPKSSGWKRVYLADNELTNASLPAIASLSGLEQLKLSANVFTDISALAGMSTLEKLEIHENAIISLAPLQGMYNSGSFHGPGSEIKLTDCGLDLSIGTADRAIIDNLIAAGVSVEYEEGNIH